MANQSVISIPPNVDDPLVLRRVLSRMTEVLDQVSGVRASRVQGAATKIELEQAIERLRLALLRQIEVASKQDKADTTDVTELSARVNALAKRVGINEVAIQALIEDAATKMHWRGAWDGTTHYPNDVAHAGGETKVCNTETLDSPATLPQGSPTYPYAGTLGSASILSKQVIFGHRYNVAVARELLGYKLHTVAGNAYNVLSVRDPLGANPITTDLFSFVATSTGEVENSVVPIIVEAGVTFDLLVIETTPTPSPIITQLNYNYSTPDNETVPINGQLIQATKLTSEARASIVGPIGEDNQSFLTSLTSGDKYEGAGQEWTIQGVQDEGSYVALTVSPAIQGAPDGLTTFSFEQVPETSITYPVDPGYWTGSTVVRGLFSSTGGLSTVVENDNAYGLDTQYRQISRSPDWDDMP